MVCSFPNFTALFESGIQDEIVRRLIRQRLGLVFSITPRKAWTPLKLGNSQMLLISLQNRNRFHWISGDFTITGSLSVAAHLSRQEALPAQCTPHQPPALTESLKLVVSLYFPRQLGPASCLPLAGAWLAEPGLGPVVRHLLDVLCGWPGAAPDPDPHAAPRPGELLGDHDLTVVHTRPVGLCCQALVLVAGPGQGVASLEGWEPCLGTEGL